MTRDVSAKNNPQPAALGIVVIRFNHAKSSVFVVFPAMVELTRFWPNFGQLDHCRQDATDSAAIFRAAGNRLDFGPAAGRWQMRLRGF